MQEKIISAIQTLLPSTTIVNQELTQEQMAEFIMKIAMLGAEYSILGHASKMRKREASMIIEQGPTDDVIGDEIAEFKEKKRKAANVSNEAEFLQGSVVDECARTRTKKLDRSSQMKLDIVNNLPVPMTEDEVMDMQDGISKRLDVLKAHLDVDLAKQLSVIENHVIALEKRIVQKYLAE